MMMELESDHQAKLQLKQMELVGKDEQIEKVQSKAESTLQELRKEYSQVQLMLKRKTDECFELQHDGLNKQF